VEVDAVIPEGHESESCLEPEIHLWLHDDRQMAVKGQ